MATARTEADEPMLIEEKVETGLAELMASCRSNFSPGGEHKDELQSRFTIHVQRPLPSFSHDTAKAFEATDTANPDRACYALVLDNWLPYRMRMLEMVAGNNHSNLQNVLGFGTVNLSHLNEARMVIVFERIDGKRLSESAAGEKRIHEHQVIDHVLSPLAKALQLFRDKEMVHGGINMQSVFLGENFVLSECVSYPCGHYQHYLYEPLERLMADQNAKGAGDAKTDVYAAGVLAFELIYGIEHLHKLSRDDYIRAALELGPYQIFSAGREISVNMADFFRGILNDNRHERWDLDQMVAWLGGKRFNMIVPPTPREATRALTFVGQEFYSRRALANAFHKNWRVAIKEVRNLRLDRWFEMSMHRPELADRVERILRIGGEATSEKNNNDMMSRLVSNLDPVGPIRTTDLALRPEGIGQLLADLFQRGLPQEMSQLMDVLEYDIPNYWAYLTEESKSNFLSQILWRCQRVRPYIKNRALGFGLERLLYEFNPNIACQSSIVKKHHVLTLPELLRTLDAIAHQQAPHTSFIDRHLIAFIAAKLEMGKEQKITDLTAMPTLANHQELIALRILGKAQQRHEKLVLPGLATWVAMRVELLLNEVHNRTNRKKLKLKLKTAAASGNINDVLSIIVNREMATKDFEGFARAVALYEHNDNAIAQLNNPKLIGRHANELGGRIAMLIAYFILFTSAYLMFSQLMNW